MRPAPALATFVPSLRAFVVAGGRSSRMGSDKALLPFGKTTLLGHAIARARGVTADVRILCGPERRYEDFGAAVIEDPVCGVGPLAGLYAALLSAVNDGCERILWLGVDLPHVRVDFLKSLAAGLDHAEVVMASTERGLEPLCAAFRTEPTLAAVRRALLDGRLRLTSALEGLAAHAVDTDISTFTNVNTRADYEELLHIPGR